MTDPITLLILWAVIGYLLGSIPTGVIVARAMGLGDLRQIGSGNIGATNVLRTGNKQAAALTLIGDAAKGAAAVLLARQFATPDAVQIAALGAMVGHCFPVWLGFRGGKGVATFLGIMLALMPLAGLAACAIWALTAKLGKISSLAALLAAGWTPVVLVMLGRGDLFPLAVGLAVLVYGRHWGNISRLRAGTEPRIGASKSPVNGG
ncbi:acyl-phosphate glycerol-3-phosphate acyltransferase [Loktanella fryxellensis]|uniref:Glycerol-3-phosphate acyltransferase n=1 Tax=Loktanella fryxellensis TaxID=245187 RepID=A0A1H8AFC4_9RHOB|nr:glycerol-3-phosphate 1-O-acyltransferase PlsY [Loktanella fryxellensis]SEM69301.1 acyl-phosphate glycerol-3-phosphate acyltransferase [Loktanella fryxellensis]